MKQISEQNYQTLIQGAELLKRDKYGDKVWRLSDGRIAKLFRVKRRLSSARIFSYAKRFRRNSLILQKRGIQTITVDELVECKAIERQIVIYHYLAGETLSEILTDQPDSPELIVKLAQYLAMLHARGIYFRSVHTGNIVRCENGELGIIDISDMRFSVFPLSVRKCARNFHHMLRYPFESGVINAFGTERFIHAYLAVTNWSSLKKALFMKFLPASVKNNFAEK